VTAGALVDEVWGAERPPMPQEKVWVLDDKYAGQSVQGKFKDIAAKMGEGCDSMLVTALDDIAWMLNLRGNDIEYNPLFFSYVLLHREGAKDNETYRADLFID
jgi:Xaa-Pro aminopeptidase